MASSGALAEFARMPPQRKVMVFAVIYLTVGAVYWKFAYKALDDDFETAQAQHDSNVQTNKRLADDIPKYQELRAHMAKLQELIDKNQTALPSEAEVPAFFETLQRKVAESGVEIRKWSNLAEEPVESFVKVPVEIQITGTFMQIKRFFASLIQRDVLLSHTPDDRGRDDRANEEHERIVSIENLALSQPVVKNREIILDAKFTAVTFRQEDKPPPGAAGAAGAGGAGGAGAKPATPRPATAPPIPTGPAPLAPPPLPSAATPAGAKARVERSLEQHDAVNRKALDDTKPVGAGSGSARLKGGL